MKKLMILVFSVAMATAATAQKQDAASAIYQELEQNEDVFTLSLNKKMLESVDTEVEWGELMRYVEGDLHRVKVMIVGDDADGDKIAKYIYRELKKLGYKKADFPEEEKSADEEIFLFSDKRGKKLTEAHILVHSDEGSTILLSIYGDLTVTDEKL